MPQQTDNLPSEVKEKMPQEAQQMFAAAFNSATGDGMSEEAALNVAWNSIKYKYEKAEDGTWHRKQEDSNVQNKSVASTGGY